MMSKIISRDDKFFSKANTYFFSFFECEQNFATQKERNNLLKKFFHHQKVTVNDKFTAICVATFL